VNIPLFQEKDALELFDAVCCNYLSKRKTFRRPLGWKEIVRDSTTSCLEGKTWKMDNDPPAVKRGVSKIIHIPRELKEQRAACLEEYTSALRIRWIDASVGRIIKNDKRYGLAKKNDQLLREQSKYLRKSNRDVFCYPTSPKEADNKMYTSYCRDFKKEGLTKPRNLLKIMLMNLKRFFPEEKAFDNVEFFDDWKIDLDGQIFETTRGHGLGMANELTTLMQFIIEDMVAIECGFTPMWSSYVNDDAATIFTCWRDADIYRASDMKVCKKLGLAFKAKASFISIGSTVLCENYTSVFMPQISDKQIFVDMAFGNCFKAINRAHAKKTFETCASSEVSCGFLNELHNYWGYVLSPKEFKMSTLFGGWYSNHDEHIKLDFVSKQIDEELSRHELVLYEIYKTNKVEFKPWEKHNSRKAKICSFFEEDFLALRNVDGLLNPSLMFRPSVDQRENVRAWIAFEERIKTKYKTEMNKNLQSRTWGDLYDEYTEAHPELDVLPPKGSKIVMSDRSKMTDISRFYKHPFLSGNMFQDYDLYLVNRNKYEYNIKMNVSGYFSGIVTENVRLMIQDSLKWKQFFCPLYSVKDYKYQYLPDIEVINSYHHPLLIAKICENHGMKYSVLVPNKVSESKLKLLSMRDRVYGKLDPEKFLYLSQFERGELVIISSIWELREKNENLYNSFVRLFKNTVTASEARARCEGESLSDYTKMICKRLKDEYLFYKKEPEAEEKAPEEIIDEVVEEDNPILISSTNMVEDEEFEFEEGYDFEDEEFEEFD